MTPDTRPEFGVLARYHELGSQCRLTHAEHHYPIVLDKEREAPVQSGPSEERVRVSPPTVANASRSDNPMTIAGTTLRDAALSLVRAYDANVDAINGLGHVGEDHDKWLHFGPVSPDGVEIFDTVGDCAACGGAQYGSEDAVQHAIVAVKLALGEPLRPYEEHQAQQVR